MSLLLTLQPKTKVGYLNNYIFCAASQDLNITTVPYIMKGNKLHHISLEDVVQMNSF